MSVWWHVELIGSNLSAWRIKWDVTLEEVGLAFLSLNLIVRDIPLLLGWSRYANSFLGPSSVETVYVGVPVAFVVMLDDRIRLHLSLLIRVQSLDIRVILISLLVEIRSGRNLVERRLEERLRILSLIQKTHDVEGTLSLLNGVSASWPIHKHLLRRRRLLQPLTALFSQEVSNFLIGIFNMAKS